MQTTAGILVAALLASAEAATLPLSGTGNRRSIGAALTSGGRHSVHAKRNANFSPSGPHSFAKAHLKFGKSVPNDTAAAVTRINTARVVAKRDGTGSAANTPTSSDSEYLTPVQIGTPAQDLNLDFDTGSSDLWVFSTNLPTSEVNGQTKYDPSASTSAQEVTGAKWSISYGDGSSSSGLVYMDKVTVGGLSVTSQAVEPASTVSSSFTSDSDSDGLLGLAFSSINTVTPTSQTTFYDTAKSQLTSNLFTADLNHQANGTYNFGFIDTAAYTGDITYTKVSNTSGFWGFTASGYTVGTGTATSTAITGIADTGTTLMLLPNAVVKDYYTQVSGAQYSSSVGGYVFSCSQTLPDFSFTIASANGTGTGTVQVPGSYINYTAVDTSGSTCYGGIQSDASIGFSIFGDVALKAAFVVFDGANNQLGWAAKSAATAALTGSKTTNAAATTSSASASSGKKKGKGNKANGTNKQNNAGANKLAEEIAEFAGEKWVVSNAQPNGDDSN